MTSPADRPRPPRHPKRLAVAELERHAAQLLRTDPARRPGLIAVRLDRSDRVRALLQRPDALQVLAEVCDRFEAALRPTDHYSVVAVDEIWVLLTDAPGESMLRLAASALRARLAEPLAGRSDEGTETRVGLHPFFGGAWIDQDTGADTRLLPSVASHALAEAKGAEDGIVIAGLSTDRQRQQRAQLEARLRRALDANELEIWYQPQVRLATRTCDSLEALVRWPQPQGASPVSPALVASICEEHGMINELTRFNVNTVLRTLMGWQARGQAPQVGINLSALTLGDANFPVLVSQACEMWGMPASQLLFELTESSIAQHERSTIEFMNRLGELGCGLSIDDFGTGYSSFAYLRQFPVDELKIDRTFVRNLATDTADRRIVKVLIEVAHAFGLRALAEGVEEAEAVQLLAELGCDAIQGWYFAKAMPAEEALGWIERFNARSVRQAETIGSA